MNVQTALNIPKDMLLAVFLAILFSASHVLLAFGAVLCMLNKNDYMGMCTSVFSTY